MTRTYQAFAIGHVALEWRGYEEAPRMAQEQPDLERLRDAAYRLAVHGVALVKAQRVCPTRPPGEVPISALAREHVQNLASSHHLVDSRHAWVRS